MKLDWARVGWVGGQVGVGLAGKAERRLSTVRRERVQEISERKKGGNGRRKKDWKEKKTY